MTVGHPQPAEHLGGIGPDGQARTDFTQRIGLLEYVRVHSGSAKGDRGAEAADPASDDQDSRRGHRSTLPFHPKDGFRELHIRQD
jgi:hypothetical protein